MFNKNMFKAKVAENGVTTKKVAEILGINETTLYRKMSGESDFTRNEIQLFKKTFGLSSGDVDAIFFAQ